MAINLVDRFFEKKIPSKNNVQLVGLTALLIASKFEVNNLLNLFYIIKYLIKDK